MKLLQIGCCVQPAPFNGMQRAFIDNCDEYKEINCGEPDMNNKVIEIANYFQPDLVFMQIQTEKVIERKTLSHLKKQGAFIINWTGDIRHQPPKWMIEIADLVDLTCFSNMRDVDWMKKHGYRSEYLEQGYDETIYKPEGEALEMPPVVYFANNYTNQFALSKFRIEANSFLQSRFKNEYGVYGNGWNNAKGNFNSSQPEEAKAYRGAKIAINLSNYEAKQYSSDRIHRIMGTGTAICLSHWYPDIDKVYTNGYNIIWWHNLHELERYIRYFLDPKNEGERGAITANGLKTARSKFTFNHMVGWIKELYYANKEIV